MASVILDFIPLQIDARFKEINAPTFCPGLLSSPTPPYRQRQLILKKSTIDGLKYLVSLCQESGVYELQIEIGWDF
jgi:hypothetical protein